MAAPIVKCSKGICKIPAGSFKTNGDEQPPQEVTASGFQLAKPKIALGCSSNKGLQCAYPLNSNKQKKAPDGKKDKKPSVANPQDTQEKAHMKKDVTDEGISEWKPVAPPDTTDEGISGWKMAAMMSFLMSVPVTMVGNLWLLNAFVDEDSSASDYGNSIGLAVGGGVLMVGGILVLALSDSDSDSEKNSAAITPTVDPKNGTYGAAFTASF